MLKWIGRFQPKFILKIKGLAQVAEVPDFKACLISPINAKTTGLCNIRLLNCCKSYSFCDR